MNARPLAHSNDNRRVDPFTAASPHYRRAVVTSQRSGIAFETHARPILAFPPLSVWLAGAAVWAFIATVVALCIAVVPS